MSSILISCDAGCVSVIPFTYFRYLWPFVHDLLATPFCLKHFNKLEKYRRIFKPQYLSFSSAHRSLLHGYKPFPQEEDLSPNHRYPLQELYSLSKYAALHRVMSIDWPDKSNKTQNITYTAETKNPFQNARWPPMPFSYEHLKCDTDSDFDKDDAEIDYATQMSLKGETLERETKEAREEG